MAEMDLMVPLPEVEDPSMPQKVEAPAHPDKI